MVNTSANDPEKMPGLRKTAILMVMIGEEAACQVRDVSLAPATRRQHALVAKCDVHSLALLLLCRRYRAHL